MRITIILLSLLLSGLSFANYTDTAEIKGVKEVYRTVQVQKPYQYCYEAAAYRDYRGDGSATNELIGGIIGGAIGNQFGKGSGRDVATVAGVLLGASIANDQEAAQYNANTRTREVCETRYRYEPKERFSHYLITYNYNGIDYTYRSDNQPKSDKVNVRVTVNVEPESSGRFR